jgi:two-component system CitB family sensor kinase
LALVSRVVARRSGDVSIEVSSLGGASFDVWLPAQAAVEA